jgi:hypothetical protein
MTTTTRPRHVTPDHGRDLQLAVHQIAKSWIARGFCPACVVRELLTGAVCAAQDACQWSYGAVHDVVEGAYAEGAAHIWHGEH